MLPGNLRHWLIRMWCLCTVAIAIAKTDAPATGERKVTEADRQFWSFRPLKRTSPPLTAPTRSSARCGIDAFWLQSLASHGLTAAPRAPRHTLLRRLALDLTGLPPSTQELAAFETDSRPDSYERWVDHYLSSPQFGERWARHWLDLVRYADSAGFERDTDRPTAWHYRDWVIRALNDDLPFDTFIRWQLAGDQLEPNRLEARVATAFLGLGAIIESDTKLPDELARYRYADLDDMLSTTGSAMLGLTVGCARCHDHKYDPIPTRDYYRLLCAFTPVVRREWLIGSASGSGTNAVPTAFTVMDGLPAPANFLMKRGEPTAPGEAVQLGFLRVLSSGPYEPETPARPEAGRTQLAQWLTDTDHGAGILLARVLVNRLWQHHFGQGLVTTPSDFGTQGEAPSHPELLEWLAGELIRSGWKLKSIHRLMLLSECYQQGQAGDERALAIDPENRWLWHRRPQRIESEVLRDGLLAVSGTLNPAMGGPGIKAPVPAELHTAYNTRDPYPKDVRDTPDTRRRSVYLFTKRSLRQPLLELFDGADPSASCARRLATTVAPQALALLNDEFVRARAHDFARRLRSEAGDDPRTQVARAYRIALSRPPTEAETNAGAEFITAQTRSRGRRNEDAPLHALADFCQVIFGLNEFVYVD